MSSPNDYIPILIQAVVALGFVVTVLVVTHILGPKLKGKKKDANWECGIEEVGNARFPVSIRYFMTAILFVLFDVEVIFFYPYAVNFRDLELDGLWAVMIFVGLFLTGFFYVLKKGALEWEK
ncbi:MAG: NADH-quinone oxidoreductase subunit A [Candidatus Fluviicola riflensis]|nr:MAG: NADH-quinone oxidoreductase subunit A [Candidatus Fluviicola riflensis]OGS78457.1 MAG: NADH-quinone oxidoreductase subunit A [Candidatus Fluviicola riflensis]OGS85523.1 MAG: NADH-quinone oxidoreductase subunit A [Fluviicola sp. RIFCSPHIGHO2_01_FULL_43_53]OGS87564.1 MAG: NADH-quinone oxidoreductase subunit A [Fluviicola sp. RIFCSPHIGHO2_12_FULL_43_24]